MSFIAQASRPASESDATAQTVIADGPASPPPGPIALVNVAGPVLDPLIGQQVGSFIIVKRLGQGGMGAVYLGEHPTIGSKVAIKFLHPALSENPNVVRRFYAEARAANLASHEHIVRVLDLNRLPGRGYYLVMEYVEGRTLAEQLGGKPQPLAYAGEILLQLCEALSQAHARGVVHRDLKPENVLVTERRGQPFIKVADFGIAKLRELQVSGAGHATQEGLVMGTPAYMSPEQCEGREIDPRADIYSLGVMAFQLVTGRLPFEEQNFTQLLLAHLNKPAPSPRALRPELPHAWEGLILRAMSKRPEERFPDVGCFAQAVQEAARAVVQATATPPPRRLSSEGVQVEVELVAGGPPWIMRAVQLSRAGAFVCFAGQPPPLQARIALRFPSAAGGVPALGEVVRHVSAAEGHAWNMEPGFALQFVDVSEALRAHIKALADADAPPAQLRSISESRPSPLERYGSSGATHYEILGVGLDAGREQILARARAVQSELAAFRGRALALPDAKRLEAACQRVQMAVGVLGAPAQRLAYDAALGNYRGVARALMSGLSRGLVEAERARFLTTRPTVEARVGIHLARAKLARAHGNLESAARELEQGLTLDPLNLALHDARARLAGQVP